MPGMCLAAIDGGGGARVQLALGSSHVAVRTGTR